MQLRVLFGFLTLALCSVVGNVEAATASDATTLQRVAPAQGIALDPHVRAELEARVSKLGKLIESLPAQLKGRTVKQNRATNANPKEIPLENLIPDAAIYHKAVSWALIYHEFFRSNEIAVARQLIDHGTVRAEALAAGTAPWLEATGLVVRAYVSKIDGSIQPYGLVVPASYPSHQQSHRLDVWLHGRDNNLTELKFIAGRERSVGEFAPPDTIVLHPYGRYCNAFKFAGEVDVLEAMEHAQSQYAIDKQRMAIRGFSMGGAGVWHLAAHHASLWAGAAPGAGFAETAEYSGILKKQPDLPWYERTLWHLYDATDYAVNLFHCPTIAYSGEIDKQKQAADIMERALAAEGLDLVHLIGPNTAHKYEPETKKELSRQFDALMSHPQDSLPKEVRFTTWTLRYNQAEWITLDGLEHHWKRARVNASITDDNVIQIKTVNVSGLAFDPIPVVPDSNREVVIDVDGQTVRLDQAQMKSGDSGRRARLAKNNEEWHGVSWDRKDRLRKRPGLQGPIDDAFLDRFIMVRPTGKPLHEETAAWVETQMADAILQWRAQFRGDAIVKDDVDITKEDMASSHLVLWGDPRSNRVIRRLLKDLPLSWKSKTLRMGTNEVSAATHLPVLIYPNPMHPDRYIVLNSGFTFSEAGNQSNSMQTPKLPDWAIRSISQEATPSARSDVRVAGFFDENWKWSEETF